jgi:hypothetical protein
MYPSAGNLINFYISYNREGSKLTMSSKSRVSDMLMIWGMKKGMTNGDNKHMMTKDDTILRST